MLNNNYTFEAEEKDQEKESNRSRVFLDINKIKQIKFDNPLVKRLEFIDLVDLFKVDTFESYLSAYEENEYLFHVYRKVNGYYPDVFKLEKINVYDFIEHLFDNVKIPKGAYFKTYSQVHNKHYLISFLLTLSKDLFIYIDEDKNMNIFYDRKYEEDKNSMLYILLGLMKGCEKKNIEKNKIHVIYRTEYGFDKQAFNIKKVKIDIDENYNDDFRPIYDKILNSLNDNNRNGLVILSGIFGSGKTMCIRSMISKLKKNIIFIPPDMVAHLADPSFIPFLIKNNNTILIIEDAEPALQKRDNHNGNGAVSNILNMTDGLLSDCVNISIVATFNTDMKNIDEALLRKGRLMMNYKFEKLCVEKTKKLLKKLGNEIDDIEILPMTLAEIYYYKENNNVLTKDKKIGF